MYLKLVLWWLKYQKLPQQNEILIEILIFEGKRGKRGQRRGQWWRGGEGGGERRWIRVIIFADQRNHFDQ